MRRINKLNCHGPRMRATQFPLLKWCRTQLGGPQSQAVTE
jgi:hypothetical protein